MPQKNCRKLQPPEQGARALQTDDRQTDGRAIAYSEREREFTCKTHIILDCTATGETIMATFSVVGSIEVKYSHILYVSIQQLN